MSFEKFSKCEIQFYMLIMFFDCIKNLFAYMLYEEQKPGRSVHRLWQNTAHQALRNNTKVGNIIIKI